MRFTCKWGLINTQQNHTDAVTAFPPQQHPGPARKPTCPLPASFPTHQPSTLLELAWFISLISVLGMEKAGFGEQSKANLLLDTQAEPFSWTTWNQDFLPVHI